MPEPTSPARGTEADDRPDFLKELGLTPAALRQLLDHDDGDVRAHVMARLMRLAEPDGVLAFVDQETIREHWFRIEHQLGDRRGPWAGLVDGWGGPTQQRR